MAIRVWDHSGTVVCQWNKGGPVWIKSGDSMWGYETKDIDTRKNCIAQITPDSYKGYYLKVHLNGEYSFHKYIADAVKKAGKEYYKYKKGSNKKDKIYQDAKNGIELLFNIPIRYKGESDANETD